MKWPTLALEDLATVQRGKFSARPRNDPKYYGGDAGRDAALARIAEFGCRVIVGGRVDAGGAFRVWGENRGRLPGRFDILFEVIAADEFRVDVSSTELRLTSCPSAASPSTRRSS